DLDEAGVEIIDEPAEHGPVGVGHGGQRRPGVLVGPAGDRLGDDAPAVERGLEADGLDDDGDRPGDGGGVGDDVGGGAGEVVAAAGRDVHHERDDGLGGAFLEAEDFAVHGVGGGDGPAGGIDAEDDGADARVALGEGECFGEV